MKNKLVLGLIAVIGLLFMFPMLNAISTNTIKDIRNCKIIPCDPTGTADCIRKCEPIDIEPPIQDEINQPINHNTGISFKKEYINKYGTEKGNDILGNIKLMNHDFGKSNWYMINWSNSNKIDFVKIIDNRHGEVVHTIK